MGGEITEKIMAEFGNSIVSAGAGWTNLLVAMQANGWTGGAFMTYLTLEETLGAALRVKFGHLGLVAPVSATDGTPHSLKAETYYGVDAGVAWIYTPAANTYSVSAHSEIDF